MFNCQISAVLDKFIECLFDADVLCSVGFDFRKGAEDVGEFHDGVAVGVLLFSFVGLTSERFDEFEVEGCVDAARLILEPDFGLLFVRKVFKKIGLGKQILLSSFGRGQTNGNFGFGDKLIKSPTLAIFSQPIIRVDNDLIEINDT